MLIYRYDIGRAIITPSNPVISSSVGTWKIIYTVGKVGVAKGGKVSFGIPHGFTVPQIDNPYQPGYCTATCNKDGVNLVLRCTRSTSNKFEYLSGIYGSISTGVMVHICEKDLVEGDKIVFIYGDRSYGSLGSFVRSIEGPAIFTIIVCPADSWSKRRHFYFLKDSPQLKVISRVPKKIHIVIPSTISPSKKSLIHLSAKDEFENTNRKNDLNIEIKGERALKGLIKRIKLKGVGKKIEFVPNDSGYGKVFVKTAGGLSGKSNPVVIGEEKYKLYWGDLHCHSFVSDGLNSPKELYEYAKEIDKADFCAITDHCYMTDEGWHECCSAAKKYNKRGEFVTFLGYEFSESLLH